MLRVEDLRESRTPLSLGDIARTVQPYGQFHDGAMAFEETLLFDTKNRLTFALSVHAARLAVEPRTGEWRVLDYLVVHDAGVMLDEKLVEGQIIGAVVDGIGGAMLSEIVYDDEGQLLTGSLADYMVATATEAPRIRLEHISTLPTTNPLRVRGVGEGGIIPVAPAIINAISRALVPVGAVSPFALFKLPLTPEMVLEVIESLASGAQVPAS